MIVQFVRQYQQKSKSLIISNDVLSQFNKKILKTALTQKELHFESMKL